MEQGQLRIWIKRAGREEEEEDVVLEACAVTTKKKGEGGLLSAPTCLHSDGRLRVYSSSPGIFSPCVATHHLLSFFHCGTETFLPYLQQDDTSGS
jgi:hypothetical protein